MRVRNLLERHLLGRSGLISLLVLGPITPVAAQEAGRAMQAAPEPPAQSVLEEEARIVHLLQRTTFGIRPGDVEAVRAMGVEEWLDLQLHPERIDDPVAGEVESRYPAAAASRSELLESHPPRMIVDAFRLGVDDTTLDESERREIRRMLREGSPNRILFDLTGARLHRSAFSERQLEEVMTQFWFDHFNVFFGKNEVRWLVGDYEREAIRPHVFGSFQEMLLATATHPAMLYYLDNVRSVAPDSSMAARELRERQRAGRIGDLRRGGGTAGRGGMIDRARGGAGRAGGEMGDPRRGRMIPPDSLPRGLGRLGRGGLNENYARELLELHTLGVDGGYTQDDVVQVARAFTGWGSTPPQPDGAMARRLREEARAAQAGGEMAGTRPSYGLDELSEILGSLDYSNAYRFQFRPFLHDAGEKVVLGETIPAGGGMEDGLRVLEIVATHPSTARHIATQLVTRFVADDPPQELVEELSRVFLDTEGDLREVTRALFTSEHFYAPENMGQRVKSPFTLVAGAVRLTGAQVRDVRPIIEVLRSLGEAPYQEEAPTGVPEEGSAWVSSGAMLTRMNFGIDLVAGRVQGLRPEPRRLFEAARDRGDPLVALAELALPGREVEPLVESIQVELEAAGVTDPRERLVRGLGLVLGSPDFQRH